jgi:hypothetical protein
VPDWVKAACVAVVLALIALLLLTPGAAAFAAACVLAGAAAVAFPLALPRRSPRHAGASTRDGLRSSASRWADDLGRAARGVRRALRRHVHAAQRELVERGEAVPAIALIVVSIVTWGAIALAVLSR